MSLGLLSCIVLCGSICTPIPRHALHVFPVYPFSITFCSRAPAKSMLPPHPFLNDASRIPLALLSIRMFVSRYSRLISCCTTKVPVVNVLLSLFDVGSTPFVCTRNLTIAWDQTRPQ
ncbi:hypothetical protein C8Q78DRAFT_213599 [Trametes maxima]|nr:hypothetical protein C8Q78DRAFT_213599 [Trametes maxima]